jgi:hypothetical protein
MGGEVVNRSDISPTSLQGRDEAIHPTKYHFFMSLRVVLEQ